MATKFVSGKNATVPVVDQCNGVVGISPTTHYYGKSHTVQHSIWRSSSSRRWIVSSTLCCSTLQMQPLLLRATAHQMQPLLLQATAPRQMPQYYYHDPYASRQAPLSSRPLILPALTVCWPALFPWPDCSWWWMGCYCPCPSKWKHTSIPTNTTANVTFSSHSSESGHP